MLTFPIEPYSTITWDPPSTKNIFKIEATAKQRNKPRIISDARVAIMAGRTMDVTTIAC